MTLVYPGGPAVTLTAQGLTTPIVGPAPDATVGLIGVSPIGNDHYSVMSIADALAFYSSASPAANAAATIPRALYLLSAVSQLNGAKPFNVGIMAVGKKSATAVFGTGNTASATGLYSGTLGLNLSLTITVVAAAVTAITVSDTTRPAGMQVVQQFLAAPNGPYNLSTPANVMLSVAGANATDNPNSVFNISTVGSALPAATITVPFTNVAATDGMTATGTDATITGLLAESMAYDMDLIVPLFDIAVFSPMAAAHRAACALETIYRTFVGAPASNATFASITSTVTAYISTLTDRLNVWGVPPIQINDPITGGPNIVDPFYFAVILAGMKAAFLPTKTLDEMVVPGVLGFAGWTDHSPFLSNADLKALGGAGFATAYRQPKRVGVYVKDNITAAPYSLDGQNINPFYQFSIRTQDDAVSKSAVATSKQFRGQDAPGTSAMALDIAAAIDQGLDALGWLPSHRTTVVPLSGNPFNYNASVTFIPAWPVLGIAITTSFSF